MHADTLTRPHFIHHFYAQARSKAHMTEKIQRKTTKTTKNIQDKKMTQWQEKRNN